MLWKYIMYISIKAKNLTYFSNWLLFVVPFCINHTTSSMNQVPKGTATTNGMFHTCLPPGNVIPRVFPPFTVYSPQKVKYPRFVPKPGEFPGFRCLGYCYEGGESELSDKPCPTSESSKITMSRSDYVKKLWLGGGFKYFLCSPLLREMIPFD